MSTENGSAMVISLVLLLLLVILGTSLLALSGLENKMSHNDLWAEGAIHAAEAGIHAGIDRLTIDTNLSIQAIADTTIAPDHSYRSGPRLSTTPQPFQFLGTERRSGFAISVGTGYNPSGFAFVRYQMNSTGVGPRNTRREVEAAALFGPVPE